MPAVPAFALKNSRPLLLCAHLFAALCTGCQNSAPTNASEVAEQPKSTDDAAEVSSPAALQSGQDWPCFLGPHGNGVSNETGLLTTWPKNGPPLIWKLPAGTGYSAPSVRGEKLVLHHRLEDEEVVDCLHAGNGQQIWRYKYPSRFRDPYGYNNGPRCTPILTETHCFTLGADGKLLCLEIETGHLVWQRDLKKEFDIPDGFFGIGATPVLDETRLIVAVGGQPNSGLVAFSAVDGNKIWENVGKSTWDGAETGVANSPTYTWEGDEMLVSYSSPLIATIHGRKHVLCLMRQGLVSVDPETGAENFHYWFRSRTHESVNAAQPVVVDDTILLGAAYRVGSARLQVAADGRSVETLWKNSQNLSTHWSTSIYHDGCYFGFSGRHENEATLQCVDAATGKLKWETTGYERTENLQQDAQGNFSDKQTGEKIPWPYYGRGSAILVDQHLIALGERGTLALLKADPAQWVEVARCEAPHMKYPSWTAPVLSRGKLYLRCEDVLACFNLQQPASR